MQKIGSHEGLWQWYISTIAWRQLKAYTCHRIWESILLLGAIGWQC